MDSQTLLLIILSSGFVILIAFVCVALGTMIRIMVDIRKITTRVQKEVDMVGDVVDAIGEKTKSFFAHSLIIDKIVPAVLGIITASMASKAAGKFEEEEEDEEEARRPHFRKKRKK
ncbi:MAG: hypothetical protein WC045_01105 [Patescibacteria group bacterium]